MLFSAPANPLGGCFFVKFLQSLVVAGDFPCDAWCEVRVVATIGNAGHGVGERHQEIVDDLSGVFSAVRMIAPPDIAKRLDEDRKRLADWRARVSVIGQVKAGKSTYLSTLVGKPGFLPSEVNPWTSVVTNLHFGHPDDPKEGGVFHFFDESAWERIINGDPETREMAEQLLPGFKAEVLAKQVETMQARSRKRLGRFYEMLLGKSHSYDTVTRETLERYVCVGPERDEASPKMALGRYSDITERADIYFESGPFAAPLVISDTPGVNDPFLVRDEYTCRSLSTSDIFVMTLSAHQALNDVDLALVRMLSLNSDNHIVILINRIDEMTSVDEAAPRLIEDVSARLTEAAPDSAFTVIVGSAYWAELALDPDADPDMIEREASRLDLAALVGQNAPSDARERLLAASGVQAIRDALSDAVDGDVGRTMRTDASDTLLNYISACEALLENKREDASRRLSERNGEGDLAAVLHGNLVSRAKAVEQAREDMKTAIDNGQSSISGAIEDSFLSLRRGLDQTLKSFIAERCEELFEAMQSAEGVSEFDLDLDRLRGLIEDKAVGDYAATRRRLDAAVAELAQNADRLGGPLVGGVTAAPREEMLPHNSVTPTYIVTPNTISLELTSKKGWRFWKSAQIAPAEAADKLGRLVRAEMYATIEHLANAAHMALVERGAAAIRHISDFWSAALAALEAQERSLAAETAQLHGSRDEAEYVRRIEAMIEEIEDGLAALKTLEARVRTSRDTIIQAAE